MSDLIKRDDDADLEVMPVSGVENAIGSRLRMAEMSLVSILAKTFQGLKAKISQGSLYYIGVCLNVATGRLAVGTFQKSYRR